MSHLTSTPHRFSIISNPLEPSDGALFKAYGVCGGPEGGGTRSALTPPYRSASDQVSSPVVTSPGPLPWDLIKLSAQRAGSNPGAFSVEWRPLLHIPRSISASPCLLGWR